MQTPCARFNYLENSFERFSSSCRVSVTIFIFFLFFLSSLSYNLHFVYLAYRGRLSSCKSTCDPGVNVNETRDITRDHRARLVSSNREFFPHYKHISYFFNKYSLFLYVYTRGLLGCLLGFWPLGQNPAGAITQSPGIKSYKMDFAFKKRLEPFYMI